MVPPFPAVAALEDNDHAQALLLDPPLHMTQLDLQLPERFFVFLRLHWSVRSFFRLGGDILQLDTLAPIVLDHEGVLLDRDLGRGCE